MTDALRSPIARQPAGTAPPLSKELTDFLVELGVALQRRAMYPGGHPTLAAAEQRLIERMTPLLANVDAIAVGVARDQLVIDGNATDPRNPHLSGLAERLHGHRLAGFRFTDGLTLDELTGFLTRLARDPEELGREPLSEAARVVSNWRHITLYRQSYERLELLDEEEGEEDAGARSLPRGAQLWLALAQAAMVVDQGGGTGGGTGGGEGDGRGPGRGKGISVETDPSEVAKAINARAQETGYEQAVVGYLIQIAQQLRTTDTTDTTQLRTRVSRLVSDLSPEAVHRLLEMGGNMSQRRTFLNDASAGMATDAVLTLTVAAAEVSQKSISKTLLRLLVKLANHAKRGNASARTAADSAFREHVRDMIENWTAPNPTGPDYERVLDRLTAPLAEPGRALAVSQVCEPERVIEICLELRNASASLWDAVNAMIARGDIEQLLDMLDKAPADNPLPGVIRGKVSTPENFRRVLEMPNADPQRVEAFAKRVGIAGTDVLLDVLAASQSRAARRKLLALVPHLGEGIGPTIIARLEGAPWFIQRNLLILLGNLPEWPEGFTPLPYGAHADDRVRREAIRMMLKRPATRIAALTMALGDSDPQIIRLGIDASQKDCPLGVVPRLVQRVASGTLPGELQVLAIRALGATRAAQALPCLLGLTMTRTRWLNREKLAPKSAPVLAALSALAAHWPTASQVAPLLARARASGDPEIRTAVMAGAAEHIADRFADYLMNPPIRFLHELSRALAASSLYGPQHPARYKAINTCYEALRALQAEDEEPSFSFLGRDVVYGYDAIRELQDWEWSDRFAAIGVQRIEVMGEVSPDDFAIFIEDVHARLGATANGGSGFSVPGAPRPQGADEGNLSRQTAIRFGAIGVQGVSSGGGSVEPALPDMPYSLEEESEAIRYIHSQVAGEQAVPLVEAEAVVRSLSGALHSDGQMLIPLLKLKSFDQYTTTHSINVSVLSMALAEALGHNPRDVRIMGVAGLLHDLGKVRVPPEILSKPGSLSPEERELLERHPSDGARIILNSDKRLTLPAAVAFEHHIMINGGGYPRRHFPRDCHYASTVVHVCDVYDALHTDRPYRAAWPSAKALHYIERRAEREFDPAVAGTFIALMRKNERGLDAKGVANN